MRKTFLVTTSAIALLGAPAAADPVFSLGLTFAFGGDAGITAGVWSDNREDEVVAGLTGTYYFRSGELGAGANVGYVFGDAIGSLGYDFLQQNLTIGIHGIDGEESGDGSGNIAPPPPPPPPPLPLPPPPF